jgi:trk system potassium uptake protein TrkH
MRAISVVGFQLLILIIGTIVVSASMNCSVIAALFESASASGTVGVTMGITPSLNVLSKLTMMLLMYLGRVGVLTVTYAVMVNLHESSSMISYPDANILIG